jgi:PEP-CTERM motif
LTGKIFLRKIALETSKSRPKNGLRRLPKPNFPMKTFPKTVFTLFTIGLFACGLCCQQARAQGPIVGNITFAGSVSLDGASVDSATQVTAWHGLAAGDLPQVQSRDGTFATNGVNPGDGTTFAAPWSFNTVSSIPNFWSVDNFHFELTSSTIITQGSGALHVAGTGIVSHAGFADTPGTWNFTTQDPSADSKFSFSAATSAVPEASTVALFALGMISLGGRELLRRKS